MHLDWWPNALHLGKINSVANMLPNWVWSVGYWLLTAANLEGGTDDACLRFAEIWGRTLYGRLRKKAPNCANWPWKWHFSSASRCPLPTTSTKVLLVLNLGTPSFWKKSWIHPCLIEMHFGVGAEGACILQEVWRLRIKMISAVSNYRLICSQMRL